MVGMRIVQIYRQSNIMFYLITSFNAWPVYTSSLISRTASWYPVICLQNSKIKAYTSPKDDEESATYSLV